MDWGIVGSVVVAILLVTLGILVIAGTLIALMVSGMKKKAKEIVPPTSGIATGEAPKGADEFGVVRSCPMTFCPLNKVVE